MSGKKTYIIAGVYALLTLAKELDWINQATADAFEQALIAAGLITLRSAIGKAPKVAVAVVEAPAGDSMTVVSASSDPSVTTVSTKDSPASPGEYPPN